MIAAARARSLRRTALLSAVAVTTVLVTALPTTPATADPGPTTLVGLTDDDVAPENGAGGPVISDDGSTVVFRSFGADVVDGAPAGVELFARDRAAGTTEAVDLPPAGAMFQTFTNVSYYDVSADGRYVVFDLMSPDSCGGTGECIDVYRRDLLTDTTELVSVSTDGTSAGNGDSYDPAISADGERVVFSSQATDLTGATLSAYENLFVRDFATDTTQLVNVSSTGVADNSGGFDPAISADGETVAFMSAATNLDPGSASSNDLFLRHLDTDTTEAVLPTGQTYTHTQAQPDLSADGSVVAFFTRSDLLGTGASTGNVRVYTIDLADDTFATAPQHPFGIESEPDLSTDGRYVAYRAEQPQDGAPSGVYVWDRELDTTEVESVRSDGSAHTTQPFQNFMSGDGRFVVFETLQVAYSGDEDDTTIDSLIHDRAEPTDTATGTGAASTAAVGGPTYDDTLQATVSGSPGSVTVTELETEDPEAGPIDGYSVLGQQVRVTADPAVPPAFLTFTFDIDVSVLPPDATPAQVDLFRNGAALPACAAPTDPGPCVASRTVLPSGDWRFEAHSPQASVWAVALDLTPEPPAPTDEVPPTAAITRPVDGATYRVGQGVTAAYQCSDDSGIASCVGTRPNGARIDTGSIGTKSFSVTATDNAGNTSTSTVSYSVVWPLAGLFQPIDNPPVVNTVKAGAVVPAKFSLGGYRGTQVFATGYPRTTAVACPGRPRTDEIEQTLGRSAATLSYRNGVYTYAWRSQKAWASTNTCRVLTLRFKDGQQRSAVFRLR